MVQGEGKLTDYISRYWHNMLVLENTTIDTMMLHGFLYRLKDWAWRKIERQNPTTYQKVFIVGERFVDSDF